MQCDGKAVSAARSARPAGTASGGAGACQAEFLSLDCGLHATWGSEAHGVRMPFGPIGGPTSG